jgi:predicted phosphoribosyltransferase
MTSDEATNRKDKARHLAVMLSQLRDDIDELVSGLEFGAIGYEMAVAAAKVQLRWMLNQLLSGTEPPPQL